MMQQLVELLACLEQTDMKYTLDQQLAKSCYEIIITVHIGNEMP